MQLLLKINKIIPILTKYTIMISLVRVILKVIIMNMKDDFVKIRYIYIYLQYVILFHMMLDLCMLTKI